MFNTPVTMYHPADDGGGGGFTYDPAVRMNGPSDVNEMSDVRIAFIDGNEVVRVINTDGSVETVSGSANVDIQRPFGFHVDENDRFITLRDRNLDGWSEGDSSKVVLAGIPGTANCGLRDSAVAGDDPTTLGMSGPMDVVSLPGTPSTIFFTDATCKRIFKITSSGFESKAALAGTQSPRGICYNMEAGTLYALDKAENLFSINVSTMVATKILDLLSTSDTNNFGGIDCASTGDTYFSSNVRDKIIKVHYNSGGTPTESVVAGLDSSPGHVDGDNTVAKFDAPRGVCVSSDDTKLWVADFNNHCIREIDLATNVTSTIAGSPGNSGYVDS